MKSKNQIMKCIATVTATVLALGTLTACGGGNEYNSYAAAYNKVTAKGGMEAKFNVNLDMDGENVKSEGDFKLDTSGDNNVLYYEMTTGDNKIIQFSDGEYIYTDMGDSKSKYKLDTKPSGGDSGKEETKSSSGTFNTSAFLNEFSSFLEAGKIKELGLLSPIEKAAVSSIKKDGDTYTLTFSDALVKKYLNTLVQNETGKDADETIQIDELNDFTYTATEKDGMLTGVSYKGTLVVNVPGSLLSDGEDKTYPLDMDIQIEFVNPGESVSVELPSTDGFEEIK
ncbi:MAG: hypothetical protein K6G42_09350 [Lachnospiraceae bacterium]|nr:hypothetical protein [Lachnospiraceae bacterium]